MAITPITPFTTDLSNPATFNAQATATWNQFIDTTVDELNTAIAGFNFANLNSTSTTSLSIGTGSKSLTVDASMSYVIGMTLKIAYTTDGTKWMLGEVTAYNSGTGALTVNVRIINGTGGPFTAWTVSFAGPFLSTQNNEVIVHTGNGHGSTNNKIRRFTTTLVDTGSAITYADSAANGGTFTIDEDGVFAIEYIEASASAASFGISLNSSELTTSIASIAVADRKALSRTQALAAPSAMCSAVLYLTNGDVIRAHTDGATFSSTSGHSKFSIRKVFEYV